MTVTVSGSLLVSGRMLAGWAVSHRRMPADSATFVTTGQAIEFSRNFNSILSATQGAIAFAGIPAGLTRTGARSLVATRGTFVLTGTSAILRRARKMPAAHRAVTVTGQAATLTITSPSLWPDATNTGHTGTLTLSSGNLTSSSNGQIIQNLNVTGQITINHTGVTVRNCQAQLIYAGSAAGTPATNCIIEDCTIVGNGTMEQTGIVVGYGSGIIVRRNDISGVEEGVYVAFAGTVRDNWIHGPASPADPVPEINGITCQGGATSILIEHNSINTGTSQTTIFIKSDYGPNANITVNNNKLLGGGYCVYSEVSAYPISGVSFTNNRMGNWATGPHRVVNNIVRWTGNVVDSTSVPIPAPPTPGVTHGVITLTGRPATLTYSAASSGDLPDATNTGHRIGLTPSGSITTTGNNQTISGFDVSSGTIHVIHSGCTVRDCQAGNIFLGKDSGGVLGYPCQNTLVEYCTLVGNPYGGGDHSGLVFDANSTGSTFRRNNLSGHENAIYGSSNNITVEYNYIHDQGWPFGSPHTDCVQFYEGETGAIIRGNNFVPSSGSSSLVTTANAKNFTIVDNLFGDAPVALLYLEGTLSSTTGHVVSGNTFLGDGGWVVNSNGINLTINNTFTNNTFNGVLYPTGLP